jgi:signal transduction histidine kinase
MPVHSAPPRSRSARQTLLTVLVIPLVSLMGLWINTASITLGNVIRDHNSNRFINAIQPSFIGLQQALTAERTLTVLWLDTGRHSAPTRTQLVAARHGTDTYAAAAIAAAGSVRGVLGTQAQLNSFLSQLAGLHEIRAATDSGKQTTVATFNAYSAIRTAEFGYLGTAVRPSDPILSLKSQAAVAGNQAEDLVAGAIALVDGALAAGGRMPQDERMLFAEVVGQQNLRVNESLSLASPDLAALLDKVFDSPAYHDLVAAENQIIATPVSRPVSVRPADFQASTQAVLGAWESTLPLIGNLLGTGAAQQSDNLLTQLVVAGGLGLVAVLLSVFVAVRFGRRLRAELTQLYASAKQMAEERLPRLVERLRRGDDVDVQLESPPLAPGRITEIASVAQAFSAVQLTAVEAAVDQANLRKGINQVFVSLSLRSQSLLHKQLSLLDEMERATSDPVALGDLFRLDHLTTRMRRHAEGLLILAGATPGRGWRGPVRVADVLNAAVAEVEDYVRVDVISEPSQMVAGTAVNDIIHLLAELIENATAFSPPHTRVEIRSDSVSNGFAIEIEDRGLGIPADELARINRQLASPPEFDLASTDQLGLFVTAKLAARHGIRVSLRTSPFGGTGAIVMLPHSIMATCQEAAPPHGVDSRAELSSVMAEGPAGETWRAANDGGGMRGLGLSGRHRLGSVQEPDWGALPPEDRPPWPAPPPPAVRPVREDTIRRQDRPTASAPKAAPHRSGRPSLPRRDRGTNLAPQLRKQPDTGPATRQEMTGPSLRSPDEAGGLMAELQAGWRRARQDLDQDDWRTCVFAKEPNLDDREDRP